MMNIFCLSRQAVLLAAGLLAVSYAAPCDAQEGPWPTTGWPTATPEAQDLDEAPFSQLDRAIKAGTYGYVDRLVVVRNGRLVVSERYENDYHWKKTPKGFPDTEGGLYLEAEQLAKIAYLYLQGGVWEGERILDADFIAAATAQQVERVNAPGWGYGYQWWRLDRGEEEVWAGLGFGGQFLLVLPAHDLIGVVNSWNLFTPPQASVLGALLNALLASVEG